MWTTGLNGPVQLQRSNKQYTILSIVVYPPKNIQIRFFYDFFVMATLNY